MSSRVSRAGRKRLGRACTNTRGFASIVATRVATLLLLFLTHRCEASFEVRPGAIGEWPHLPPELPGAFDWRLPERPLNVGLVHLAPFNLSGIAIDGAAFGIGDGGRHVGRVVVSRLGLPNYAEWSIGASFGARWGASEGWLEVTSLATAPRGELRSELRPRAARSLSIGARRPFRRGELALWARDLSASAGAARLGVAQELGARVRIDIAPTWAIEWSGSRGRQGGGVRLGLSLRPASALDVTQRWSVHGGHGMSSLSADGAGVRTTLWRATENRSLPASIGAAFSLASAARPPEVDRTTPAALRDEVDPLEVWEEGDASLGAFDLASIDSLLDAEEESMTGDRRSISPAQAYVDASADSIVSIAVAPDSLRSALRELGPRLSAEPPIAPTSRPDAGRAISARRWHAREEWSWSGRTGSGTVSRGRLDARFSNSRLELQTSIYHPAETGWLLARAGGTSAATGVDAGALRWGEGLVAGRASSLSRTTLAPRRRIGSSLVAVERDLDRIHATLGRDGDGAWLGLTGVAGAVNFGLLASRIDPHGRPGAASVLLERRGERDLARVEVARVEGEPGLRLGARLRRQPNLGRARALIELSRREVAGAASGRSSAPRENRAFGSLSVARQTMRVTLSQIETSLDPASEIALEPPLRRESRGELLAGGPLTRGWRWSLEGALSRRTDPSRTTERSDLRLGLRTPRGLLAEWSVGEDRRATGTREREALSLARELGSPGRRLIVGCLDVEHAGGASPRWFGLRQSAPRGLYLAARGERIVGAFDLRLKVLSALERRATWAELRVALKLARAAPG